MIQVKEWVSNSLAEENSIDPEVSILIITYNSENYILETLESAKAQTYRNIELVISDDASTDNTLKICGNWIEKNKERFVRSKIVTTEVNKGIPANCNQGVEAVGCEWIKLIAGDDILDSNCISYFMECSHINPEACMISSSIQLFTNDFKEGSMGKVISTDNYKFFNVETSAEKQYWMLLRKNYVHGPSTMFRKSVIINIGGFDEKYKFFEDYPLFLNLTKAGYKIYPLNKVTVYYRRHDSSVLRQSGDRIFSDFYLKRRAFDLDYIHPNITRIERIADNMEFIRLRLFDRWGLNKERHLQKMLFTISNLLNPARIIRNRSLKRSVM